MMRKRGLMRRGRNAKNHRHDTVIKTKMLSSEVLIESLQPYIVLGKEDPLINTKSPKICRTIVMVDSNQLNWPYEFLIAP